MPLQTTEENELAVALGEPRLETISEAKLKDMLRYCYVLVGIRAQNLPAEKEKEFLHQFIRSAYGNHTAAEVRLAFDMAVQGRLGVDPNTYENFSCLYFASIMNAYRRWAAEQFKRLESKAPPPESTPTPEQLKKIDQEYEDYLLNSAFNRAFSRVLLLNQLPTTLINLYQWRKANFGTK